jgi:membrane protein DedA with SNARE-associated domain
MADWIIATIESTGYLGIVALTFIENVFPPVPSELIIPLAGYLVSRGEHNFIGVVVAGTTGSVLGALPWYYAGVLLGEERLKRFADERGRWLTVSRRDLERAKRWFDQHGAFAVILCRLVPGLRSLISVPAGIVKMGLPAFLAFTALGAVVWTALLAYAGFVLGEKFGDIKNYLDPISYVVLALILILYGKRLLSSRG